MPSNTEKEEPKKDLPRAHTHSTSERVANAMGEFITAFAMFCQGLLALLLADQIILKLNEYFKMSAIPLTVVRIGADVFFFFAAEEGKRRLVRYYNVTDFLKLGNLDYWKSFFDKKNYTVLGTIASVSNFTLSLPASLTFAYIGKLSLMGTSPLFASYDTAFTQAMSVIVTLWYLQIPFELAPLIANMLGFPNIHNAALELAKRGIHNLLIAPGYRELMSNLSRTMEATRLQIRFLYEHGQIDAANALIDDLHITSTMELPELRRILLENYKNGYTLNGKKISYEQYKPKDVSWTEFRLKLIFGSLLVAVGFVGFYNFLTMANDAANEYGFDSISFLFKWVCYFSMCALAFNAIYGLVSNFVDYCYDRDVGVNIFSKGENIKMTLITAAFCIFGVFPNVYQNLVAKLALIMLLASGPASSLTEANGFFSLTKTNATKAATANNPELKRILEIDDRLRAAANLESETLEEVLKLDRILKSPQVDDPAAGSINVGARDDEEIGFVRVSAPEQQAQPRKQYRDFYENLKTKFWGNAVQKKDEGPLKEDGMRLKEEGSPLLGPKPKSSWIPTCIPSCVIS